MAKTKSSKKTVSKQKTAVKTAAKRAVKLAKPTKKVVSKPKLSPKQARQAVRLAKKLNMAPVKAKRAAVPVETKPKQKVTKEMKIGEIVRLYPDCIAVLFTYGIQCVGCGMMAFESLEQGCKGHGLTDSEIDEIVKDMNVLIDGLAKNKK